MRRCASAWSSRLRPTAGTEKQGQRSERLVAYWVGHEAVDAAALRSWLSDGLPDYMVPAAYVQLELPHCAVGYRMDCPITWCQRPMCSWIVRLPLTCR